MNPHIRWPQAPNTILYSGTHEVKINGGADIIEQAVPAIVDSALQERAQTTLTENKRYPDRKNDRKYLLSGLVTCAVCGSGCGGHPTTRKGKNTTTRAVPVGPITSARAAHIGRLT